MTIPRRPHIEVHLGEDSLRAALRDEALTGLTSRPKELSPKWFYDERGSALFEEITRLPEYYPSRCETEILSEHAVDIPALTGAETLIELGSGSSTKTRLLLEAFIHGRLSKFVTFDVSEAALRASSEAIALEYPGIGVHAVVGDFDRHLGTLPSDGRRLVVFLGGTIGNFPPAKRARFLGELASLLKPGDSFLLGTDLVKDTTRLEAAYDDARGVTADFNLNLLNVLNRELGADFDLDNFAHVARFDPVAEWIEMRLRSLRDHRVGVPAVDLEVGFSRGEEMRTEISSKFHRSGVEAELADAGLELARWWTDPAGDFGLSLSFR